jgi:hypothetical protein
MRVPEVKRQVPLVVRLALPVSGRAQQSGWASIAFMGWLTTVLMLINAQPSHGYQFSAWSLAWLMILFAMGFFALLRIREMQRRVRLLARGRLVRAKLVDHRVDHSAKNAPRSQMAFTFVDGQGKKRSFEVSTDEPSSLMDDAGELALYDPNRPSSATTIDHLPGKLEVRRDRVIAHASLGALLIAPSLAVAGIAATVLALAFDLRCS